MKISIIKSNVFETNNWAGGTTTELYIYPEEATYQKCNFDFRLSKAHVADEASVFTSLPSIKRKLMVLEGNIRLKHKNQYSKQLALFDVDSFDGGWLTSSAGSCTDFNLMTKGKTNGGLKGFEISEDRPIEHTINTVHDFGFIYNFKGKTKVDILDEQYHLEEGDLMIMKHLKPATVQLSSEENSILVLVTICANQNRN